MTKTTDIDAFTLVKSEWKWSQYMRSQCGKLLTLKSNRVKFLTNFMSFNIVGLNPLKLWWNTKRPHPPRLIVSRFQRCSLIKNAQLNSYRARKAWCYTQQYPQCWAGQMIKQTSNQTRKTGQETRLNCKGKQLCKELTGKMQLTDPADFCSCKLRFPGRMLKNKIVHDFLLAKRNF